MNPKNLINEKVMAMAQKSIQESTKKLAENLDEIRASQNEIIKGIVHLYKCIETIADKQQIKLPKPKDVELEIDNTNN